MSDLHRYTVGIAWTGNLGRGTSGYTEYSRNFSMTAPGRPPIAGSSDPAFRGDAQRWNPEQMLVGSLAACHKLWYLHLCADAGVVVTAYEDAAEGRMRTTPGGSTGSFEEVRLRPVVEIAAGSDETLALSLHDEAHRRCFIANSVQFPVHCEPIVTPARTAATAVQKTR